MNVAKFAVRAIKEWNPAGPEAIKRRAINKAYRRAFKKSRKGEALTPEEEQVMAEQVLTLPNGETITRSEPIIPARTSTKATVGSLVAAYPVIEIVQFVQGIDFPWPWLESFTGSPVFEWLCYTIVPVVIARFTKSPLTKQAL